MIIRLALGGGSSEKLKINLSETGRHQSAPEKPPLCISILTKD